MRSATGFPVTNTAQDGVSFEPEDQRETKNREWGGGRDGVTPASDKISTSNIDISDLQGDDSRRLFRPPQWRPWAQRNRRARHRDRRRVEPPDVSPRTCPRTHRHQAQLRPTGEACLKRKPARTPRHHTAAVGGRHTE